jgi:hypothetical protein
MGTTDMGMAVSHGTGFDMCPSLQALEDWHLFLSAKDIVRRKRPDPTPTSYSGSSHAAEPKRATTLTALQPIFDRWGRNRSKGSPRQPACGLLR